MAKKITFTQTIGGAVTVPDHLVEGFELALADNELSLEFWHDVMMTFEPSHHEGLVLEVGS